MSANRWYLLAWRLAETLLAAPGDSDPEVRRAAFARSAALGGDPRPEPAAVPAPFTGYVDTVALRADEVTDDDIEALRRAGCSEDAILEVTLSAALGAGLGRLERGLAALRGVER